MGLQEARGILFWHKTQLGAEIYDNYDYEKQQLYEALEFAIDKLDREIASYCNFKF